jgi:flagellar M-ring protein FliF
LPKTGRTGFEIFDKSNLTATDFAEHVNFARALEGELERTMLLIEEIEKARVHITFPKESVFLESRQPGKASVVVGTKAGRQLSPANVSAIVNLVASAVQGLAPEAVAVVDIHGQLIGRPRQRTGGEDFVQGDTFLEYRLGMEREMQTKLTQALDPVLGEGRFRAGVSVECDFSAKEESEEALDPSRTVKTSEQKSEESNGARQSTGVPGTASNLPRPTSKPTSTSGSITRSTQNATYQATRSVKMVRTPRGQVNRISAAILVDHDQQWSNGKVSSLVPPSPEKLKVVRDIAAGILGLREDRGDQITVETLPFDSTLSLLRTPVGESPLSRPPNRSSGLWPWEQGGSNTGTFLRGAAALTLLIVFLVIWYAFRRERRHAARHSVEVGLALPPSDDAEASAPSGMKGLEGQSQASPKLGSPAKMDSAERLRAQVLSEPRKAAMAIRQMISVSE